MRVNFTSGSKEFITTLEGILRSLAGLSKRTIYELRRKNISYYIRYPHKDCLKFFDYIYAGTDESMWLERKHQKFLEGMRSDNIRTNTGIPNKRFNLDLPDDVEITEPFK